MTAPKFDTKLRPQDDFFGYINNRWLTDNPIPPSETRWGTFDILRDRSWSAVNDLVQELISADETSLSSDQRLLKTFFVTGLDFDKSRDLQIGTLRAELGRIDKISSPENVARYIGGSHRTGIDAFWSIYVGLDDQDSSREIMNVHQSGLTLPNRDYYLEQGADMVAIREAYAKHFVDVTASLPGVAIGNWQTLIDIETELAAASSTDVELRDVEGNYHFFTLADLREHYADFAWDEYFQGLGWHEPSDHIVIGQPNYLDAVFTMIKTRSLDELKTYLRWCVISDALPYLSSEHSKIAFELKGRAIGGAKEQQPLWKRVVLQADMLVIGEALGREYAARHFPESSKRDVLDIVEDIRRAYHNRIDRLTWMSDGTKLRADAKLDALKVFIGYPDVWRDIGKLEFVAGNHLQNVMLARSFWTDIELAKIGQKPAAEDWEMNAHTVNAYHHPNRLEIVFPAAILQPPFYDPTASYAANLGGIGAVIGHEFTHGFDDQGSQFDERGNVKSWQTDEERAKFDALAQNIKNQANAFETVPGVFLQGDLIIGEAIADVGGLELAVESLLSKNPSDSDIEELFVNFAFAECGQATKERLIQFAKVDPHPPSPFRVNCVVNHIDKFYDIYDVKQSDGLYLPPEKRARIW